MKAIILLICRSRFHVPRVGGFIHSAQFAQFTHPYQPFVFEGRALDVDEFNTAAARLLDVRNPNLGYEVSVRMVPDEMLVADAPEIPLDEVEMNEGPAPDAPGSPEAPAEAGAPVTAEGPVPSSPDSPESLGTPADENADGPPAFVLEGNRILLNGERIAGLFGEDKQLRVTAAYSALRPEIEAWLQNLKTADQ